MLLLIQLILQKYRFHQGSQDCLKHRVGLKEQRLCKYSWAMGCQLNTAGVLRIS